jgi:hypothetical protein
MQINNLNDKSFLAFCVKIGTINTSQERLESLFGEPDYYSDNSFTTMWEREIITNNRAYYISINDTKNHAPPEISMNHDWTIYGFEPEIIEILNNSIFS